MGGDNDDESHDYESGDFGGLGIMTNIATFSSRCWSLNPLGD